MINAATRAMNLSSHTLGDLRTFVQADAKEAQRYLQSVKQSLVSSGRTVPPAIEAILNGPANELDARITTNAADLAPYFPEQPQMWAQLQAQRAQTIGWTAGTLPIQHAVTGKLDANGTTLTTAAGATYNLAAATRNGGLPAGWLTAFRQDGEVPITVRGTIGADGKTFLVEDYAPGSSADFTSGRVDQSNTGVINTARGPVRVTDAAFLAKLQRLPRLGVILPGAPSQQGTELVYSGNPAKYYALGRFGTFPGMGSLTQAVNNAQQLLTMYEQQRTTYTQTLTQMQTQLQGLQVTPANEAETAAYAALTAAEAAVQQQAALVTGALTALQNAQLAVNLAAANPATAPAAQQQLQAANAEYTAASQRVSDANAAVGTATQAAIAVNAQWSTPLSQRQGVVQSLNNYQQALDNLQPQITAAQATLTQAQAAVAAAAAQPQPPPNAVVTGATGDFAYSTFSRKPINIHGAKEAQRANHNDRMWALGGFTFDAQGVPQTFEADYLSLPLGGGGLTNAQVAEADDWLAALATTEAGVEEPAAGLVGPDFERRTP